MKPKNFIRKFVKCRGCGKRILLSKFKYCPGCVKLWRRLDNEDIPPKGKKYFWAYYRKYGRKCDLSGVSLEIDDDTSPWYLVFSRLVPGDNSRVVPAAALINQIKSALLKKEFRYYVLALDDNRRKHVKIKKRPVVHWRDLLMGDQACPVCGRSIERKGLRYCARCSGIVHRMKHERFSPECISAVLDYLHTYGFVDYYTGMPLVLDDPKSPWYLVFDHWKPRDPRRMVVTSALVNRMKGVLTEKEFWYFIRQLANHFRHGTPVRKIKLAYWYRPYRSQGR